MASNAIDHLRALLDHLDGEDRAQQLDFFRGILAAGPAAVQELDGRLPGARAPRALRQLALESSFYFPWPDWVPILSRILRYESDPVIFETGVRALGNVGNDEALEVLRELNFMRQETQLKEILAEVLAETDPKEAFNHYLTRLLEGSGNPGAANEAAQRLGRLVNGDCLEPLKRVAMHPDLLVFRHALLLMANIFTEESAVVLLEIFQDSHQEVLADRVLKETLGSFRSLPSAAAREFAVEALKGVEAQAFGDMLKTLFEAVLVATEDPKPGPLGALVTQTVEAMHIRSRRLSFAVDAAAEGLAGMVAQGLVEQSKVMFLLVEAYREQTGREGLARAIARLVPADASATHSLILGGPDGAQRAAAVEILGGREEIALQPVLLQACRDPLTDIADRALYFVGRLPEAESLTKRLLQSANLEDLNLGLRLVAEHRFRALVPDLLEMARTSSREELVIQVIEALGKVGAEQAAEPLLEILHSGQSPRLQMVLAQALRELRQPEVALALCAKADEIRMPALHALALEALAEAHGSGGPVLAAESGQRVLDQVRRAWMDRNPWALRMRVVQALLGLQLEQPETWQSVSELLHETLGEKRPQGTWTPDELHQMQAAGREFSRRGGGVKTA